MARCTKCSIPVLHYATKSKSRQEIEAETEVENERIIELIADLKESEKRKIMRQLKKGEIDYDPKHDRLFYTESG